MARRLSIPARQIAASITAVSPTGVEHFETASTAALEQVFADKARRDTLVGCAPAAWDAACATTFLQKFGRRARSACKTNGIKRRPRFVVPSCVRC